jgi:hypothetical protein
MQYYGGEDAFNFVLYNEILLIILWMRWYVQRNYGRSTVYRIRWYNVIWCNVQ